MKLLAIIAVSLSIVPRLVAQENYMVHSIVFSGNKSFAASELRTVLLEKESPAPFYQFTYRLIHIIGGPPAYFDPFVLRADLARIRDFYKNNGFSLSTRKETPHVRLVAFDHRYGWVSCAVASTLPTETVSFNTLELNVTS